MKGGGILKQGFRGMPREHMLELLDELDYAGCARVPNKVGEERGINVQPPTHKPLIQQSWERGVGWGQSRQKGSTRGLNEPGEGGVQQGREGARKQTTALCSRNNRGHRDKLYGKILQACLLYPLMDSIPSPYGRESREVGPTKGAAEDWKAKQCHVELVELLPGTREKKGVVAAQVNKNGGCC